MSIIRPLRRGTYTTNYYKVLKQERQSKTSLKQEKTKLKQTIIVLPPSLRLFQSYQLNLCAPRGECVPGLLVILQLHLETQPTRSPENNLHNRIKFSFVENNIIRTTPDSPANSINPYPNQLSNLNMLIREPGTKHMADRSRRC